MCSIKLNYYDGPYVDSGLTPEEREKKAEQALEESKDLKEWPDV